ncbi:MAG TPA: trypsin-like peptidase domain-containing protein [Candidatus Paceibacterota bacterium]|nr:trypsin-like peptidase domain-containing protein [Candidatus Paceibacterota bacterium]
MQGLIAFLKVIVIGLGLFAHAVLAPFMPHSGVGTTTAPVEPAQVATSTSQTPIAQEKSSKTATTATSVKPKQNPVASPQASQRVAAQAITPASVALPAALPPSLSQSVVNEKARAALVNILCITKGGGYLNPISGSGVMIATGGIVLTNAHVGQYFLLRDYIVKDNVTCTIRTGSPAHETYTAKLLYLPPAWIDANASQLTAAEGEGTGENDYAFLIITAMADGSALPQTVPALSMTVNEPFRGEPILIASYPAQYLEGITIEMNLYISSALTTVQDIFAFTDAGTPDLMSVGNTIVSQAGSSGGAVVRIQDGALQGIVSTATEGNSTSARELHAITLSHIDRSLRAAGQGGIAALLTGNLAEKASTFAQTTGLDEQKKLFDVLGK